jgi:alanyl-tRNA synthetase
VDTGMGFERMCTVLQRKSTIYETDLFTASIKVIEKYSEVKYENHQRRFRIVADHTRTAFMLINDGLIPSNIAAGYVLRMIIRRMVYNMMFLKDISLPEYHSFLQDILSAYQDLRKLNQSEILRIMLEEITSFKKTIQNGMNILSNIIKNQKEKGQTKISGQEIFKLYDTYGFPIELTQEIAQEAHMIIDRESYEQIVEQAREKSRQATKEMFKKGIDWSKYLEGIPQTEFIGYESLEIESPKLLKEIDVEGKKVLIFDKTPFYPEMGGQM